MPLFMLPSHDQFILTSRDRFILTSHVLDTVLSISKPTVSPMSTSIQEVLIV